MSYLNSIASRIPPGRLEEKWQKIVEEMEEDFEERMEEKEEQILELKAIQKKLERGKAGGLRWHQSSKTKCYG